MADFASMNQSEIRKALALEPSWRSGQIFQWLQKHGAASWEECANLPQQLRDRLEQEHPLQTCRVEKKQISRDGTVKYLLLLQDGEKVESVLLSYGHGLSICLSTQVGCKRGCVFCASTKGGCRRNLTAGEILGQLHAAQRDLAQAERGNFRAKSAMAKRIPHSARIGHVVLMGIGEPLDNLINVMRFLELLTHKDGLNISMRSVSLSTCGVAPKIRELAKARLGLTLSVSLHAATDEKRTQIMPVNREYPLQVLIPACRDYTAETGRRITFEYAMLKGFNDSNADAKSLAQLIKGMRAHVNLIPINPADRGEFFPSSQQKIYLFKESLEKLGVRATVRRTLGPDISAACGQLRNSERNENA